MSGLPGAVTVQEDGGAKSVTEGTGVEGLALDLQVGKHLEQTRSSARDAVFTPKAWHCLEHALSFASSFHKDKRGEVKHYQRRKWNLFPCLLGKMSSMVPEHLRDEGIHEMPVEHS